MSIDPVSTAQGRYYSRLPEQLTAPVRRGPTSRNFDASLAQAVQTPDPHADLRPVDSAKPAAGGGPSMRMDIDPALLPRPPRSPAGESAPGGSEASPLPDTGPSRPEEPDTPPISPPSGGPVMRADVLPPGLTAEEEERLFAVAKEQARHLAELRERRAERAARQSEKKPALDNPPGQVAQAVNDQAAQVVKAAAGQIGRGYHAGGSNPKSGFDCSGLTNWAYAKIGLELPRSSRDQFQEGSPVAREDLKRGDLVFFGSKKRVSHVGVYIDNGEFIHASSGLSAVKVSSLGEAAWEKLFIGARRHF